MDASPGDPRLRRISPALSRRDLLVGAALGGAATGLAACGFGPAPSAASAEPSPTASPLPTIGPSIAPPSDTGPSATPGPTLREMIAALIVVGFRGSTLDDAAWLSTALRETGLGGVILFDRDQETGGQRNVVSPDQVAALVGDLRAAAGGREIVVSVDQEGGRVTRLSPAHGFPAVASEAEIGAGSIDAARTWARAIAATLTSVGINLNLAPVVDLDVNPTSPPSAASIGRSRPTRTWSSRWRPRRSRRIGRPGFGRP
jgi:beta-N-acetylhexosaminidase